MTKAKKLFRGVEPELLFDVLNDPLYRKEWDDNIIEVCGKEKGKEEDERKKE